MTPDQLFQIIRHPQVPDAVTLARCNKWIDALNAAMAAHEINTSQRIAHFVAQVAHESGLFVYVRELWGPTAQQSGYEGRADLGNSQPGDGFRFRGRGLIQITGRANYRTAGQALGLQLEDHPEQLELPDNAANSAAWFWQSHGLNALADTGDVRAITKRINGGFNGLDQRIDLTKKALIAMEA